MPAAANLQTSANLLFRKDRVHTSMSKKKKRSIKRKPAVAKEQRPDSLAVPNHLNRLCLPKLGTGDDRGLHYSIVCLAMPATEDESATLAFVDSRHNCQAWVHRQVFIDLCDSCQQRLGSQFLDSQPAPTWMDPEVFVRYALADEELQSLLRTAEPGKHEQQIAVRLQALLEIRYFGYLRKRFDLVKELLSQWLVAYWLQRRETASKGSKHDQDRGGQVHP